MKLLFSIHVSLNSVYFQITIDFLFVFHTVILNKQFIGDSSTLRSYLEEKLLPRFIRANILDRSSFTDAMSTQSVKLKTNRNDIERDIANNVLFKYFNFMNGRNYTDLATRFVNVKHFF